MNFNALLNANPLEFIPPTDVRLNQPSKKVCPKELHSQEIQDLIQAMLQLAGYEADPSLTKKKSRLVGLAAPQVGVMKQIIIVDTTEQSRKRRTKKSSFEILINPQIIWFSKETKIIPQGCFSVPDQFKGAVERPNAIVVKALTPDGQALHKRYEGYTAHVIQHEVDHLNGIRFPERLYQIEQLHLVSKKNQDLPEYRRNWEHWPHHPTEETWLKMKKGDYQDL